MTFEKILNDITHDKGYGRILLEQCVLAFLNKIAHEVGKGNEVQIPEFGAFKPSTVKAHKLSFDSSITVPAKTTIIFSADDQLKKYINEEDEAVFNMRWKKQKHDNT